MKPQTGFGLAPEQFDGPEPVNLGAGAEIAVRALGQLIVELTGYEGNVRWNSSKPDGQPRRSLDTSRGRGRFARLAPQCRSGKVSNEPSNGMSRRETATATATALSRSSDVQLARGRAANMANGCDRIRLQMMGSWQHLAHPT